MAAAPTQPKVTLGDLLKRARKDAGLQQSDLAKLVGCSRAVISKWELDYSCPDFVEMKRIVAATGADWLLTEPFRGGMSPTGPYVTDCHDTVMAA